MNSNSRKQSQRRRPHRVPSYTNQTAGSNYASHQPVPPKDPPYERQTEKEECEIVDLINAEDFFKRYDLGPILFDLLVTTNVIPKGNDYDFSDLLDILLVEKKKNPAILPRPLSDNQVLKMQLLRNEVDHNNWKAVQTKYKYRFPTMIALATSLDRPLVAGRIAAAQNRIEVDKDFTGGVKFRPFRFPQNGSFDVDASLGLCQITARIFNTIAAPATWDKLDAEKLSGSPAPSMDLFANVGRMIEKLQADSSYLPPGAMPVLKSVKQTRLDVTHGYHEILLKEFETKYLDLVRYLRLIRHTDRADKVKEIRIKLMALKRSGQEVKPEDFPSLYN
jgi:hypothetical protein